MFFKKAVLVIHGFAGGVYDEEKLINYLQLNKSFDVFSYTLPGHEKNLSKVNYEDWMDKSIEQVEWLIQNNYKTIYVIGHSMGGVIASFLATKYKQIKKLVLAAPAFEYLQVKQDSINLVKNIKETPSIIKTHSFEEVFSRLLKLNIGAVKEFRKLVKAYYDCPKNIDIPILILQGTNDKIVPISSSTYVYESVKSKTKKLVIINDATHDIFKDRKIDEINKLVEKFLLKKEFGNKIVEM